MPTIIHRRGILVSWCVFAALAVLGNLAARFFCGAFLHMRCHLFWPMNVFWPRTPHFWHYARAAFALAAFTYALRLVSLKDYSRGIVCAVSLSLILCTNFIAGGNDGFVMPVSGVSPGAPQGVQYFHEALKINDLPAFVSGYQELQPHLSMHARTHPPGPVILIYALHKLLGGPQAVSVALAVFATLLSGFFLFGIAERFFRQKRLAGLTVFLFFLIPAVQVYYCASVDAIIAALFLGVVYFFLKERSFIGLAGAALLLIASSLMSFSFLFLLPVIAASELLQEKKAFKAVSVVLTLLSFYAVFYLVTGFNYLDSFLNAYASHYARVSAWPLTARYLITRLQGAWEMVLFLGPFLALGVIAGCRVMRRNKGSVYGLVMPAFVSLGLTFLGGMFPFAETARICLFFYPFLVLAIASWLDSLKPSAAEERLLLQQAFGQSVVMQLFGFYFW